MGRLHGVTGIFWLLIKTQFDSQMSLVSQKLVTELSEELEHSFEYRAP